MMHLGSDGVFVGSGIFKSENPEKYAKAIVQATANYEDFGLIVELSKGLGSAMPGIEIPPFPKRNGCRSGAGNRWARGLYGAHPDGLSVQASCPGVCSTPGWIQ